MLRFYPKRDITARELCEVVELTGSIELGTEIRASRLRGKNALTRHFACVLLDYSGKSKDFKANDCLICIHCPFKDEED